MNTPTFFFLFLPIRPWEREGDQAVEIDEEGFQAAMASTDGYDRPEEWAAKGRVVASNYRATCPLYRGYWSNGIRGWVDCGAADAKLFGAAYYEFCRGSRVVDGRLQTCEDCPRYQQHMKEEQQHEETRVQKAGEGHPG